MKEKNMKRIEGFPPITEEQRRELAALAALPDSAIDTSDIPEWTEQDFSDAMRLNGRTLSEAMRLYRIRKAPITARIDMDILEWLKSKGEGYQTRLNTILREAMQNDLRQHRTK
jgi:uncharacterized protein (DUF4415 family)